MQAKKAFYAISAAGLTLMSAATTVMANTSNGTDFQTPYQKVVGWATGLPIIILVLAISFAGFIKAVRSGEIIMGLVYCVLTAFIYVLLNFVISLGGTTF